MMYNTAVFEGVVCLNVPDCSAHSYLRLMFTRPGEINVEPCFPHAYTKVTCEAAISAWTFWA